MHMHRTLHCAPQHEHMPFILHALPYSCSYFPTLQAQLCACVATKHEPQQVLPCKQGMHPRACPSGGYCS